uniref:Elongation of fatty acids protein n=1 Tax=Trypanosoma vivax (strain Y486) TaxID=1055687 RepID=G0TYN8_TRYVY|nr:putative fatty acid elongase [Trypanosoma vivax Y486]
MFPYVADYDGYALRQWMIDNVDIAGYLSMMYLVLVWKGSIIADFLKDRGATYKHFSLVFDRMGLGSLHPSQFGHSGGRPALLKHIQRVGLASGHCEREEAMTLTSPVGYWVGLFTLSKIPELFDTVLLIMQCKQPPFLHWYHHVTVLVFAWHTFCEKSSTMTVFVAMNLTVHSVMYFYFALCACGLKRIMRNLAPLITTMQILQMVAGTAVTVFSAYVVYMEPAGMRCDVSLSNARMGVVVYASYLYLFSVFFARSYLWPKKDAAKIKGA